MTDKEYSYWLHTIPGIGRKKTCLLLEKFGTAKEVFHAKEDTLETLAGIRKADVKNIIASRDTERVHAAYEKLQKNGIHFILAKEQEFPDSLRTIYDPPLALYYRGTLPAREQKAIAIVGARDCSAYGREIAKYLGRELGKAGFQIISGLARGVDVAGHQGALESSSYTCAVMGCGIDICTPLSNLDVYLKILKQGGILSEYGVGIEGRAGFFPERNRIITGLCDGIIVVEARKKSGSLISAELALEQGRDVFAVPGRIGDELSEGCNKLIQQGAYALISYKDILEYYKVELSYKKRGGEQEGVRLLQAEKLVYACLDLLPKHIDRIAGECKITVAEAMHILMVLERENLVRQEIPCYFSRIYKE